MPEIAVGTPPVPSGGRSGRPPQCMGCCCWKTAPLIDAASTCPVLILRRDESSTFCVGSSPCLLASWVWNVLFSCR